MREVVLLGLFGILWGTSTATITFDSDKPGTLPSGWRQVARAGPPPEWQIVQDGTAPGKPNVLAQLSTDKTRGRWTLAIYDKASFANGEVSVSFKPVSGTVDQSAGIVWRYRDPNNYYAATVSALDKSVALFKVVNGRRIALDPKGRRAGTYGVSHDVPAGKWNLLHLKFKGPHFTLYYDHSELFAADDSSLTGPGRVGLWTGADSVAYFDNFQTRQD